MNKKIIDFGTRMNRITLILDALTLDAFQSCMEKGNLSFLQNYTYKDKDDLPAGITKGLIIHEALAVYNKARIDKKPFAECALLGTKSILANPLLNEELSLLLLSKFSEYCIYYRDDNVVPVAIEQGFSRVIYQDQHHLFIYEGRPDFVGYSRKDSKKILFARDHKIETIRKDLAQYRNQFMGYCWYLKSLHFEVDYIGLQKNREPSIAFKRNVLVYSPRQIRDWKQNTVNWFFRVLECREHYRHILKSLSSCDSKYGRCKFYDVCNASSPAKRDRILKEKFKIRKEPWSAWN